MHEFVAKHGLISKGIIQSDGAVTASQFLGDLIGTASYALSASWAPTGSSGTTLGTGSSYPITASWSLNTTTASYVSQSIIFPTAVDNTFPFFTGSTITTSSGLYQINNTISASIPIVGSLTGTASYSNQSLSASFAITAAFASTTPTPASASWASSSISSSYAKSASYSDTLKFTYIIGDDVYVGNEAGNQLTLRDHTTAIGYQAGSASADGQYATLIGERAGASVNSVNTAVMLGAAAGLGGYNLKEAVIIGQSAGAFCKTGSFAVFIGANANSLTTSSNCSNSIALGYQAKVDAPNTCVIGGTGNYAVNTVLGGNTAVNKLDVVGNISASVVTASLFFGTASYANQALSASYAPISPTGSFYIPLS